MTTRCHPFIMYGHQESNNYPHMRSR